MGIVEHFKNKKEKQKMLIESANLTKIQKQNEKEMHDRETFIRLYYVAFEKFTRYGTDEIKIGQTYGISSPFKCPNGMSIQDACKVVSYLSDMVENRNRLEHACEQSIILVSHILEDYGFKKIETKNKGLFHWVSSYHSQEIISSDLSSCKKIKGVIDLFTVGGDFKIFKKTDLYDRYFDWYGESISQQEIVDIYKSIGQEHWLTNNMRSEDEISL